MFKFVLCVLQTPMAVFALLANIAAYCLLCVPAMANEPRGSLEERVAELEASMPRNGTGKVNIDIYGQVNRAMMLWDDGVEINIYAVDNETSSTRFGLNGVTNLGRAWRTGFKIEAELPLSSSDGVTAVDDNGSIPGVGSIEVRQSYIYGHSKHYGRLSVGYQSPASDDITLINLGSKMNDAALHYNNSFTLRSSQANLRVTWGEIALLVDSLRGNFVRYDTPIMAGVQMSAAWGEDDVWDIAIRTFQELNGFKVAAGVGYQEDGELELRTLSGSASLIHEDSGLYASVAGGLREGTSYIAGDDATANFYYVQAGISRKLNSLGRTTFYADYGRYNDFSVGNVTEVSTSGGASWSRWGLTGSEVTRWGVGVEQAIDSAALLLYGQFHYYEASLSGVTCVEQGASAVVCTPVGGKDSFKVEPWSAFIAGARIQF